MPGELTVVICTHDRAGLLERTLASLNAARRPPDWRIELLVVANACRDGTVEFLRRYQAQAESRRWIPLRFAEEPNPGKSRALNLAIGLIRTPAVAYVDDDHRVAEDYLAGVCAAFDRYPDAQLFCGRIIPDWDGSEPAWVHDTGPYRIYPLPVPRFDLGEQPVRVEPGIATPGGGNLCLRSSLFGKVGRFSLDLGPTGHDLGGAEDIEWVKRAIALGATVQYVPDIVQHHYVDPDRLRLGYLVRKSYLRSSSIVRLAPEVAANGRVPAYMYRKMIEYFVSALFSLGADRRRFYLVRLAAALGEIHGVIRRRGVRLAPARET
jgi:GT2 family glycosyltransferase